jgi:FkbM family methyltransferase
MDPVRLLPRWIKQRIRSFLLRRGFVTAPLLAEARQVWIDVGAHLGEGSLEAALANPQLLVFAFEPNWDLARQIMGKAANFVVLPIAVSDKDGIAYFHLSASDGSSSLTTMEDAGLAHWKDFGLTVQKTIPVPTMRVDTFMKAAGLRGVDYLKVDAEGVDLRVVQSAGDRLRDIRRIKLEVDTAPDRLYRGAPGHDAVLAFFQANGFTLTETETQNSGRQENLTFTRLSTQC